ncbi:MAG: PAS domain S-box protein [Promethearchaeota archaeon]
MKVLLLSHFNAKFGPLIFMMAPETSNKEEFDQIPSLMDLYSEGYFMHVFGDFKSANYIFNIPSERGRGKVETLLISIVVDMDSDINLEMSKELLEGFVSEFQAIEDSYKAFLVDRLEYADAEDKLQEVKNLFDSFYKTIPKESVMYERKDAKILVFGLSQAGKTTIMNSIRKEMSNRTLPTTYIDISKIVINNISMYAYDTPGQVKYRDLWTPYLKNQDGLVFVLDIYDKKQYYDARKILHNIVEMPEMEGLPLLVLFNKMDLIELDINDLKNEMEVEKLSNRPLKCFLTSALTNKNVDKAFFWFSERLGERLYPPPKTELGIILSRWDESTGPNIIAVYPKDAFEEPDVLAIRCFSISQFVFGGKEFKRISVILPFTHLRAKAAIYFDVVEDESVRGGFLPLSLVIFFHEKFPRAIIDQFNSFIFEKFTEILTKYKDDESVHNQLEAIHEEILKKLKVVEPTVKALRIAEMRYQSLFMTARDAILIIDRKSGIIVDANNQAEKIIQRPPEDIIGMHVSQLQLEGEKNDFTQKLYHQLELEYAPPLELKIKNPRGKGTPVEINASEIQMGGQNLIQCIMRDVTERKLAEIKLKNSENKYRHLFSNSPFSIILVNSKGLVVDCNPAIEQLLGYRREELIYSRFDQLALIHPKYLLMLIEGLKDAKKSGGETYTILDAMLNKKDGTSIWANIQSSQVQISEEKYIQIIIQDVTKQKEAENALRESQQQYHRLYDRANFYKELFAQDVKNIFKRIQSSIQSFKLDEKTKKKKEATDILDLIRDHSISGSKLVSNVRKLALIEDAQLSLERIEVNLLLDKAIKSIQSGFQDKDIDIKIFPPNKKFYIRANEILLDVFDNVLINVIEYNINPTIEIYILISREHKNNDEYLRIEFSDKTIDTHQVQKEREGMVKQSRGMLLGLTFVDQIISSLNGEFMVKDSNFIIILPEAK